MRRWRQGVRPADKPRAHDTLGVALACTGKLEEAAAEFEKWLEWSKNWSKNPEFKAWRERREAWIKELKAGRNPIDARTLKELWFE